MIRINGDNRGLSETNFKLLNIRDFETFPRNRRKEVGAKISILHCLPSVYQWTELNHLVEGLKPALKMLQQESELGNRFIFTW